MLRSNGIKCFVLCVMIGLVAVIDTGCIEEDKSVKETYRYTFRLAESHPKEHPTTQANYEFSRIVKERTDGRVNIVVYENESLGDEKDVIEQVQFGAIDFARVSIGPMSEFVPDLNVIQLPYLYEDGEHMWRVLNSDIGEVFLSSVESYNFIGLTFLDAGARNFYTKDRSIENVEDLKGLKIRVMQSAMMTEMIEAVGAVAIAMPYSQVYSSILTGRIDAAENNWISYETSSHYEVASFYSVDEHIRVPEILVASQRLESVLSEQDMTVIMEAAKETQLYQRKLWEKHSLESQKRLEEEGVKVIFVEDREVFRELMEPLYEKYGGGYEEIIDRIKDM